MAKEIKQVIKSKETATKVAVAKVKASNKLVFTYRHTVDGLCIMEHGCVKAVVLTKIELRLNEEVMNQIEQLEHTVNDIDTLVECMVYRNLHSLAVTTLDVVADMVFEELHFEISSEESVWAITELKISEVLDYGIDFEELYKELEEAK